MGRSEIIYVYPEDPDEEPGRHLREVRNRAQKLSWDDVFQLRKDWASGEYESYAELGRKYNITRQQCARICKGQQRAIDTRTTNHYKPKKKE